MLCEFCGKEMEDLYLLTLPCGYVVCHDHLRIQGTQFNCLVCQDHFIETKICFEMKKNRTKLNKMEFFEKKIFYQEFCDKFDHLDKKVIDNPFSEIVDELSQRRNYLMEQFSKKINDHYLILKERLEREESCFLHYIKPSLETIDTAEIRKNLNFDSDLNLNPREEFVYYSEKNSYFSDLNTKNIGEFLQLSENLKKLKSELNDEILDLDESKLFGKYTEPILPCTSNQYLKPFLYQFVSICQIGLRKFEELSTGHLIAVDRSNSTLIKINPLNGELNEISEFKIRLFFSYDDQIVTISEDNFITIWKEEQCSQNFKLFDEKIYLACLFEKKLITLINVNEICVIDLTKEKIENTFSIEHFTVHSLKALSQDTVIFGHDNKITMWEIQTGRIINSFCTAGRTLTIERIDDKKFLAGLNDGQLYRHNHYLIGPFRCHSGPVECIKVCDDESILTCGSYDGIKLWTGKNMKLLYHFEYQNYTKIYEYPFFKKVFKHNIVYGKILKRGNLIFVNAIGEVFSNKKYVSIDDLLKKTIN